MHRDLFTTSDGTTLKLRHWGTEQPRASALIVHGLGEHSGRYSHVGSRLAEVGIATTAFDLRGHGETETPGHVETFEHYLDDVGEILRTLDAPRVLIGHSLGGLICALYAVSDREQPDLLVLSAPALGADIPLAKRVAAKVLGRFAPRLLIPNDLAGDQLAADPAVGEAYFADPLVYTKTSAGLGLGMLNAMEHVATAHHRIRVPTLVVHGGADTVVPARYTAVLADHPEVQRTLFPANRHESFNEGPEALEHVIEWLDGQLAGA